jgi:PAS domain S-box-containing protein
MNPAAELLTGWRLEDALGKAVSQVLPFQADAGDACSASMPNAVDQALAEGRVVGVRHARNLLTRTQDWVPVDESAGPVDDDFGRPMGAVVVIRDARGRLLQEAQLRSSEARFRNAFDHAPLGMALVSMAGRFIQVNAALSQLLAMTPETLQDRLVGEFSVAQDMSHEAMRLQALTVGRAPLVQFEKRFLRGVTRDAVWTLVSVSLISQDDEPTCFLYQIHDLTDQRNAAEHLAALTEQRIKLEVSEQVMRTREDFFSRANHEMRTPLNAVMGFAQLLQLAQDDDSERTRNYAAQIIIAGKHLLEMVNDVLDIRRASSGELRLKIDSVPLGEAVRTVVEMLMPGAQGLGVSLSMQVPDGVHVRADPTRLRQVLFNVIGNGVKYNRSGGTVQIQAHADSLGIELIVSDTGLGLRPDQLDHIFQPFNRLGREHSSVEGVGLGLVITRNLLEKMGGSIHLESESDVGTKVVMRFVTCA